MSAQALHGQFDFHSSIPIGQRRCVCSRLQFVEADYFGAAIALEVRMLVMSRMTLICTKTPHPVGTDDPMRKVMFHQPIERAVQSHAIDFFILIQSDLNLVMRRCTLLSQQKCQDSDSSCRRPGVGSPDALFRLIKESLFSHNIVQQCCDFQL